MTDFNVPGSRILMINANHQHPLVATAHQSLPLPPSYRHLPIAKKTLQARRPSKPPGVDTNHEKNSRQSQASIQSHARALPSPLLSSQQPQHPPPARHTSALNHPISQSQAHLSPSSHPLTPTSPPHTFSPSRKRFFGPIPPTPTCVIPSKITNVALPICSVNI